MIHRRPLVALAFMAPALAMYLAIIVYPLVQGLVLSVTNSKIGNAGDFVGAANYLAMAKDGNVMRALGVTVAYAVVVVIAQNAIGLGLARALFMRPRVRQLGSTLILVPTLMSAVMAAFVWNSLLAPDGAVNSLLKSLGLSTLTHVWLGDPSTALWAIALVNIWMFSGYSAAIFLAGYMNLPTELLDASSVDGAAGWRKFVSIEWPLLAPATTVTVTLSLLGSLKVFELPFVMTNGGPAGSTTTLTMLIFQKIFGGQGSFAYGATIAVLLLVVVVLFAGATQSLLRRREERI
ncbi:raffinose/stachyose/melibiose transport system permease protein [Arthrobacter pascens]|uniref:carbohydrate ABC transporter permease n=1 Tax=Arthrobacter pascens TaxID=1677 RepID=UPI002780CC3D|nr:sugar ABC transporter permease [Arthrobacter pascens]MDQ0634216.1 raffinose/stachyose/melibiose transport system permease protein [Arthrobacter pascens]